jgi:hypothetical protein
MTDRQQSADGHRTLRSAKGDLVVDQLRHDAYRRRRRAVACRRQGEQANAVFCSGSTASHDAGSAEMAAELVAAYWACCAASHWH